MNLRASSPAWCSYPVTTAFSPMARIFIFTWILVPTNSVLFLGTYTMHGVVFLSSERQRLESGRVFFILGLDKIAFLSVSWLLRNSSKSIEHGWRHCWQPFLAQNDYSLGSIRSQQWFATRSPPNRPF